MATKMKGVIMQVKKIWKETNKQKAIKNPII